MKAKNSLLRLCFILLFSFFYVNVFSQTAGQPFEVLKEGTTSGFKYQEAESSSHVEEFIRDSMRIKDFNFKESVVIVITVHSEDKFESYLFVKGKKENYILEEKNIYVLLIREGDKNKYEIRIEKQDNAFITSLKGFWKLAGNLGYIQMLKGPPPPLNHYDFLKLKEDQIITPCNVYIKVEGKGETKAVQGNKSEVQMISKDFSFKVHEKSKFRVQIGVTSSALDRKLFKIENKELTVSLDSTAKKEWKQNLHFMVEWFPLGRDVDGLLSIWDCKEEKFFSIIGEVIENVFDYKRLSVFAGLKFSTDPLDAIFTGLSYSITPQLSITGGLSWYDEIPADQKINIGDIGSVGDAQKFLKRRYSEPKFFWGISLSPSATIKALGFKE